MKHMKFYNINPGSKFRISSDGKGLLLGMAFAAAGLAAGIAWENSLWNSPNTFQWAAGLFALASFWVFAGVLMNMAVRHFQ